MGLKRRRVCNGQLKLWLKCCFTSTETVGVLGTGEPRTSTSTFTQLLRPDQMTSDASFITDHVTYASTNKTEMEVGAGKRCSDCGVGLFGTGSCCIVIFQYFVTHPCFKVDCVISGPTPCPGFRHPLFPWSWRKDVVNPSACSVIRVFTYMSKNELMVVIKGISLAAIGSRKVGKQGASQ